MKILITGSHFTPAQAVIEELKKNPDIEIVYVGRKHTMEGDKTFSVESQILPNLGVKFIPLITGRLRRSFDLLTFWSLCKIPFGFLQSFWIIGSEDPDAIVSFGGYMGVPVVIAGWLLSKKIIIHEQTLVSGLANKITSLFADKIAVSFKNSYEFNKDKIVLTGNPMRRELLSAGNASDEFADFVANAKKEKLPIIFITGGNQGSFSINKAVWSVLNEMTKSFFVVHQTGKSKLQDATDVTEAKKDLSFPSRYLSTQFISVENMALLYKEADIVVSRGGANTLMELAYFGIPTLVIPLLGLYKNEQMVNAKYFEKQGLAQVLPQSNLNGKTLLDEIKKMVKNEVVLREKAKSAKSEVITDSAKRLAQEILVLGSIDV